MKKPNMGNTPNTSIGGMTNPMQKGPGLNNMAPNNGGMVRSPNMNGPNGMNMNGPNGMNMNGPNGMNMNGPPMGGGYGTEFKNRA